MLYVRVGRVLLLMLFLGVLGVVLLGTGEGQEQQKCPPHCPPKPPDKPPPGFSSMLVVVNLTDCLTQKPNAGAKVTLISKKAGTKASKKDLTLVEGPTNAEGQFVAWIFLFGLSEQAALPDLQVKIEKPGYVVKQMFTTLLNIPFLGTLIAVTACKELLPPQAVWVAPEKGYSVCGSTPLVTEELNQLPPEALSEVVFRFSRDGQTYNAIAKVQPILGYIESKWITDQIEPGEYFLQVFMQNLKGDMSADTISVHVSKPPVAKAQLVQIIEPGNIALFDASASFDPDGIIKEYIWSFGDGSPSEVTTQPTISHQYRTHGTFGVSLTVGDNLGCRHTAHYILNKQDKKMDPKEDCGCEKMRIETANLGEEEKGVEDDGTLSFFPYTDRKDERKLGSYVVESKNKNHLMIGMRFEVICKLTPRSKPSECVEGQIVQGTVTASVGEGENKKPTDYPVGTKDKTYGTGERKQAPDPNDPTKEPEAKAPAIECPYGKDNWCDDNYHKEERTGRMGEGQKVLQYKKKHDDKQEYIWWLDMPRRLVPKKDLPFSAQFKFKARVAPKSGKEGTACECSWEVIIRNVRLNDKGEIEADEFKIPKESIKCKP